MTLWWNNCASCNVLWNGICQCIDLLVYNSCIIAHDSLVHLKNSINNLTLGCLCVCLSLSLSLSLSLCVCMCVHALWFISYFLSFTVNLQIIVTRITNKREHYGRWCWKLGNILDNFVWVRTAVFNQWAKASAEILPKERHTSYKFIFLNFIYPTVIIILRIVWILLDLHIYLH